MCLPHGLRDMYMMRLSALNEYGSGVIDILIGSNFMAEAASAAQDHMGGSINQGYNSYPTNAPVYASPPSSAAGHAGHVPSADYGPVYGTNYGY
ncbi:hypothetical protein HKD37_13G036102 [Glycine soja]